MISLSQSSNLCNFMYVSLFNPFGMPRVLLPFWWISRCISIMSFSASSRSGLLMWWLTHRTIPASAWSHPNPSYVMLAWAAFCLRIISLSRYSRAALNSLFGRSSIIV